MCIVPYHQCVRILTHAIHIPKYVKWYEQWTESMEAYKVHHLFNIWEMMAELYITAVIWMLTHWFSFPIEGSKVCCSWWHTAYYTFFQKSKNIYGALENCGKSCCINICYIFSFCMPVWRNLISQRIFPEVMIHTICPSLTAE